MFCSWCYVAHLHITHLKHEDSYLMHSTFLHLSSCPFTCLCLALLREAPRCLTARSLAILSLPFTMSSKKRKKERKNKRMRETLAELLIRVPKSNCLGEPKARWCRDIWTSCAAVRWEMCSLTKDKATPVSEETSQLVSADWINIALDWPVAVYLLRAHQRQLANLRCKDPVSRLFPFPSILAPRQ